MFPGTAGDQDEKILRPPYRRDHRVVIGVFGVHLFGPVAAEPRPRAAQVADPAPRLFEQVRLHARAIETVLPPETEVVAGANPPNYLKAAKVDGYATITGITRDAAGVPIAVQFDPATIPALGTRAVKGMPTRASGPVRVRK